ncbi:MAG: ankyrin repeat domain-containing protein [Vicinamibacterales bacterium]
MTDFLLACEHHDAPGLLALVESGFDANAPLGGKRPMEWLLEMYTRSERLPACVRVLTDAGAQLPDPALGPVLTNDAVALRAWLAGDPAAVRRRMTVSSAFTPLDQATLLHVAAEFGHADAARVLLETGADVNAVAAVDRWGLGGQTPLFHTVNAHANRAWPVLRLLLDAGARPDLRLGGLTWGRGFEWETTLFDVTPVSGMPVQACCPRCTATSATSTVSRERCSSVAGRLGAAFDQRAQPLRGPQPSPHLTRRAGCRRAGPPGPSGGPGDASRRGQRSLEPTACLRRGVQQASPPGIVLASSAASIFPARSRNAEVHVSRRQHGVDVHGRLREEDAQQVLEREAHLQVADRGEERQEGVPVLAVDVGELTDRRRCDRDTQR